MDGDNRQASTIPVLAKDPEKPDEDKPKANGDVKGKGKDESDEPEIVSCDDPRSPFLEHPESRRDRASTWGSGCDADDQSEEDLQLKSELEMLVERLRVRLPFHEYMR